MKAFEGNTRKDFGEYDIKDRQEYRRHMDYKMIQKREQEEEFLKKLNQSQKEKAASKKDASQDEEKRGFIIRAIRKLFRIKD